MTDIVDRLRDRAYSLKAKDRLCEEAAQIILDLRFALKSALDQRDLLLVKISQWEAKPWVSTEHPPD
jgi:hypothetical protein